MYLRVLSSVILVVACYLGDSLLSLNSGHGSAFIVAITDNLVHGSLAVLIWLLGYLSNWDCRRVSKSSHETHSLATHSLIILQSVACGLLSCALDLDHFLAARSLNFEDALHSPHRGVFHNSLLVLLLLALLYFRRRASLVLLIVSISSHQLRDAERRGLWFSPLGSTPPLPYTLYLALMCCLMISFRRYLPRGVRTVLRTAPYKTV